jgi:hypothetical protein
MTMPLDFSSLPCCQEQNKLSLYNMCVPTKFIRDFSIITVSNHTIQLFNQLCQTQWLIHVKCLTFFKGTDFLQENPSLHNPVQFSSYFYYWYSIHILSTNLWLNLLANNLINVMKWFTIVWSWCKLYCLCHIYHHHHAWIYKSIYPSHGNK